MGQRKAPGATTRRAPRKWALRKRNAAGPHPSRPAITPLPMAYGVRMRNTSGSERGNWATYARAAREGVAMSKAEAARRVGVDRGTVHRWETGQNKPEDPEVVQAFAEVFGLDLDEALAAAGLRPGASAPATPTRERDEEMEIILAAKVDDRTKQLMIERLLAMRERDKQRRMEDIEWIIKQGRSA